MDKGKFRQSAKKTVCKKCNGSKFKKTLEFRSDILTLRHRYSEKCTGNVSIASAWVVSPGERSPTWWQHSTKTKDNRKCTNCGLRPELIWQARFCPSHQVPGIVFGSKQGFQQSRIRLVFGKWRQISIKKSRFGFNFKTVNVNVDRQAIIERVLKLFENRSLLLLQGILNVLDTIAQRSAAPSLRHSLWIIDFLRHNWPRQPMPLWSQKRLYQSNAIRHTVMIESNLRQVEIFDTSTSSTLRLEKNAHTATNRTSSGKKQPGSDQSFLFNLRLGCKHPCCG